MISEYSKPYVKRITLLAIMVYFSSYITRINYGAIISEFISTESVAKTSAAIITTAAFITYGAGQIISGILGDRFDPKKLIFYGSLVTVAMNTVMSFIAPNIMLMSVCWGINGFAQAFMWPPLVRILMQSLKPEDYDKSVIKVAYGSSGGTIAVYLISPFIIKWLNYKYVFRFSALLSLILTAVWFFTSKKIILWNHTEKVKKSEQGDIRKSSTEAFVYRLLVFIVLSIIIQGMLRDGISTWFPNYISEVFDVPNTKSILIAVVLPVFHLGCSLLTYRILKMFKGNVFVCLTAFFVLISVLTVSLKLCGSGFVVVSVLLFALINGFAHSINVLQTEFMPKLFSFTGKISTYAGILNACTYVGSAVSTYAFAFITNKYGWNATLISWIAFAASGALLTLVCTMVSKTKMKSDTNNTEV